MSATADNCGVVIPCHNEAAAIAGVVRRIRGVLPNVVVVDDASSDATATEASGAGAAVIRLPHRSGKGSALAAGWVAARDAGHRWVLMLDGDGQHRPEEAPALLSATGPGQPLVIGNRLQAPGSMPALRRLTNRWMSTRLSRLTGATLPDSQCGFRVAHLDTLLGLRLSSRHFEIESEMCVAFARGGHAITFVGISSSYGKERSKIRPLADSIRWGAWYLRSARQGLHAAPRNPRTEGVSPPVPA